MIVQENCSVRDDLDSDWMIGNMTPFLDQSLGFFEILKGTVRSDALDFRSRAFLACFPTPFRSGGSDSQANG